MGDELKQKFYDFGALRYSKKKIASILRISVEDARQMLEGEHKESYESGSDAFDFAMDKKLMDMALSGDLKALQKIERKRGNFNSRA